ncbi:hypothetical protein AB433_14310 [Croceicoccus naphthovorans]|uniref:Uncharacterized protein n=1 Tax=Croceicoccus naphthovorans TaxID=1348774 RepID=A0A0G3XKD7_9SPHN|nr:hypothetical protein AB433_14310 [Croceicoccus naphthovorans]
MWAASLALAPLLGACGDADEPAVAETTEAPDPMASASERAAEEFGQRMPQPVDPWPDSIRGDYRLAGIDGEPFDQPFGVAIHIGQDRIEFENCQQVTWRYRYDPPALITERTPAITIDINPKPLPCAATFPPPLADMVRAIDSATQAEKTPENGLRLSGGGHSVLLFSQ